MEYKYKQLTGDNKKIFLAGIIEGLSTEVDKVKKIFAELNPNAVGLYVSEEDIAQLENTSENEKFYLSEEQEIYAHKLAVYGEVRIPWPHTEAIIKLCKSANIPLYSVDMSDEEYALAFTKSVSPIQLIRYHLRLKRLRKKKFKKKTPEEFVRAWYAQIVKLKGIKNLENACEEYAAKKIVSLFNNHSKTLVFLPLQRLDIIEQKITQLLSSHPQVLEQV